MSTSNSDSWTIFSVPVEIRLAIYHYALTKPLGVVVYRPSSCTPVSEKNLVPALLRTSKRLHAEAASLLYTANVFAFDTKWSSLRFLQSIKPHNVALLRSIELNIGVDYNGSIAVNHIHFTGPMWCEFLKKLADEASGLREVLVYFYADVDLRGRQRGAGKDVSFFKALEALRLVEGGRMEIDGLFAEERRAELERVLGDGVVFWEANGKGKGYLRRLDEYRKGGT